MLAEVARAAESDSRGGEVAELRRRGRIAPACACRTGDELATSRCRPDDRDVSARAASRRARADARRTRRRGARRTPCRRRSTALGFRMGRFKTGTPPRLLRGKRRPRPFRRATRRPGTDVLLGERPRRVALPQVVLPYRLHERSRAPDRQARSRRDHPLFTGAIAGRGPRYCPSLEDKVVRFADRERHQLSWSRRARLTAALRQRFLDVASAGGPVETWSGGRRPRTSRDDPSRLRGRIRLRRPDRARARRSKRSGCGSVSGGSDQRDDRIRGSGRARLDGGNQRGARGQESAAAGAWSRGSLSRSPGR